MTILLLASATSKQWVWQGHQFKVCPGQFITSLNSLADKAKVSVQSVRSAIARLEKLGFLTNESTKSGRLITVRNWGRYQGHESVPNA